VPHEMGDDSFYIHGLGQSIVDSGFIDWSLSPLSLLGLYPNSYASGVPTFIAIASQISGFDMEITIFFVSLFFGIFGIFSVYLLAGEFSDNAFFKILVSLIFSTAPIALKYTTWTISARGLFLMLFPLLIWALLRFYNSNQIKHLLIFCITACAIISIHKMFIFIFPVVGCLIISHVFQIIQKKYTIIDNFKRNQLVIIYFITVICLFIVSFFFIRDSWALRFVSLNKSQWYHFLFGTVFTITARYGFILIFLGGGIFYLLKSRFEENFTHIFLLVALFFFIPFLGHSMYFYEMLLPFFSIAAAFGILYVLSLSEKLTLSKKYPAIGIVLIIISLIIFSSLTMIVKYSNTDSAGYGNYMYDETYNLVSFLQKETSGQRISGINQQISAYMHNSNNPVKENTMDDRQIMVSLKPVPTNLGEMAAFIRNPFSTASSIKQAPTQNAYEILLNDRSVESPSKIKIYCNGFEELWYLRNNYL
jgi:hypothetical protein